MQENIPAHRERQMTHANNFDGQNLAQSEQIYRRRRARGEVLEQFENMASVTHHHLNAKADR
jgi:hypothetical protein